MDMGAIRSERDPKEQYFEPIVKDRGLYRPTRPGT